MKAQQKFDVVGIGNAIVDVVARADDDTLRRSGLTKGSMELIGSSAAKSRYAQMGPAVESSGGSAANTIAGLASLGDRCAFIGKIADDQLGAVFRHDIRSLGVSFDTPAACNSAPTARCLILVTPDAQRTMQTYLGACVELGPDDVDANVIGAARVTYLEGYLWDPPRAKKAFLKAIEIAHAAGHLVSLSLSDAFCVDRHRSDFLELVRNHVDLLFANEQEITSLYEVDSFDAALQAVRKDCRLAALTRSAKGSVVVAGDEIHVVDAEPVARVVDTTGAGDAYAAGFLHGYLHGLGLARAARVGGIAAAEAIGHVGARPETLLKALVEAKLA
ncbi:MAG: adenosine kinase [Rhodospirillales bacterium]|nr:adenosine kinase [Rhodospirillales bacterium]